MDEKEYHRKLWIYSVLAVLASICASGTPLLAFIDLPAAATVALGIAAIVIFVYATVYLGSALDLTSTQWLAAILLLLVAWVASAIYLVTRKPNLQAAQPQAP